MNKNYDLTTAKRLCAGVSLCCLVVGAQASPATLSGVALANTTTNSVQQNSKKITGIVKDAAGEPIIGANVVVKGTTIGAMTGLDGDFTLEVPENAQLVISYIGYVNQEIPVSGKNSFNIILTEDTQKLDEVIVLGYGAGQRKQDLSASVGV